MGMFNSTGFVLHADTGPEATAAARDALAPATPVPADASTRDPLLLAYATQTGAAEAFAHDTAAQWRTAGLPVRLLDFNALRLETLRSADCALIIASTTYDGDPPDMADHFNRHCMARVEPLPQLRYGLLALGDSNYDAFCAFGRRLHQWLRSCGARTLFAPVEVDDENEEALARWHRHVDAFIHAQSSRWAQARGVQA